ncbi:nucleoside phosphorylase domain-containing protein [Aspergillus crustosus]
MGNNKSQPIQPVQPAHRAQRPHRAHVRSDYTIAWICALPDSELPAAIAMLDERHPALPGADAKDPNEYVLGRIGKHNVVITCLQPGQTGTSPAARVGVGLLRSFPSVRVCLMVGVGGGVPRHGVSPGGLDTRDVRLGDVVVSLDLKGSAGVVQYNMGTLSEGNRFVHTGGSIRKPAPFILSAAAVLRQQHERRGNRLPELLNKALTRNPQIAAKFSKPLTPDTLFKTDPRHTHTHRGQPCDMNCAGKTNSNLVTRPQRPSRDPVIHYGIIGSADQVLKRATERDRLSQAFDVICVEMEGAGLMNIFPCLVIRGICDYSDSHKNKEWQPYAAGMAAAYAKELLLLISDQDVTTLPPAGQWRTKARPLVGEQGR